MERTPPIPAELWEQIPSHVQAVLWVVLDRYEARIASLEAEVGELKARLNQSSQNSAFHVVFSLCCSSEGLHWCIFWFEFVSPTWGERARGTVWVVSSALLGCSMYRMYLGLYDSSIPPFGVLRVSVPATAEPTPPDLQGRSRQRPRRRWVAERDILTK